MLVNGYSKIHKKFEKLLCKANGFEKGVIVSKWIFSKYLYDRKFSSKGDTLFIDEDYHASGILASKLLLKIKL